MVVTTKTRQRRVSQESESGFTLIELMIVMVIIGVLASIAVPIFETTVRRAKEAALREDLATMRQAIDSYTVDKEKAPQSLEDLVQSGYLKSIPKDPITAHSDTWVVAQSDTLTDVNETQGGIGDVHSGAQSQATDGSSYNQW